ncbi:MAG: 5'/3'-nucleotidase SurE [Chloroflexi bacterium]|nr:5'/3'-nucleotidase SurE [Chloroflexota bacterium]
MYVLLTNDDGFDSEGLQAARAALAKVAEVAVVAPEHNWSATGHNRTMDKPLRVTDVRLPDGGTAFVTDGTPSDCVSLALLGILERKPDLVVAGINKGPNLGDDITYSGTVAAAMEAALGGVPALAVSLADYFEWDFTYAANFTARLASTVHERSLPPGVLLNVNVPAVPAERIGGVEITRLGKRIYSDILVRREDPFGRPYYWLGGDAPKGVTERGTDLWAVAENRISITPIHLDLTNYRLLATLRRWQLQP